MTTTLIAADINIDPKPIIDAVKDDRETPKKAPESIPVRGPLPEILGEPLMWTVKHGDAWKGWSLTGYSWGGLTEDFRPWRFKIGMVNGEWEMNRKANLENWSDFMDWEEQIDQKPVFGISYTIIF